MHCRYICHGVFDDLQNKLRKVVGGYDPTQKASKTNSKKVHAKTNPTASGSGGKVDREWENHKWIARKRNKEGKWIYDYGDGFPDEDDNEKKEKNKKQKTEGSEPAQPQLPSNNPYWDEYSKPINSHEDKDRKRKEKVKPEDRTDHNGNRYDAVNPNTDYHNPIIQDNQPSTHNVYNHSPKPTSDTQAGQWQNAMDNLEFQYATSPYNHSAEGVANILNDSGAAGDLLEAYYSHIVPSVGSQSASQFINDFIDEYM